MSIFLKGSVKQIRLRDDAGTTRTGRFDDGTITAAGRTHAIDDVKVLPPCEPTKIVCIGRKYAKHAEELGNDVPDRPLLFFKPPIALSAHGDTVKLPVGRVDMEHKAELCVVIGEQCRNVDAADAEDVIAGYTCIKDMSNLDEQRKEKNWVRGKAFDNGAPLGPVLASPDELQTTRRPARSSRARRARSPPPST